MTRASIALVAAVLLAAPATSGFAAPAGPTRIKSIPGGTRLAAVPTSPSAAGGPHSGAEQPSPYAGVSLRGGLPPVTKTPPPGLQYINWPGFQLDKRGGIEIFLQITGPVQFRVKTQRRRVEITLDRAQVFLENNFHWMITKHFPGPVERFRLRQLKGDRVALEIRLRKAVPPQVVQKTVGRYSYVVASFSGSAKQSARLDSR